MAEQSVALGSRLEVVYAMEDSWSVLPSSYNVYDFRVTGFGVQLEKDSFESEEIRSDRQTVDLRHGMYNVSGDLPVELSYGAFDDIIESAMFNTWQSDDTIEIGTSQKSFRVQRAFTDIGEYHEFPGCVVSSWSLSVEPNSIITSTFSVMGKTMETTQTLSGSTTKASNAPFDSFTGYIYEGGNTSSDTIAVVTGLDLTLENNIEALQVVGDNKAVGLAEGRGGVSGTLTAYFGSTTLLNKFLNETESAIEFQLADGSGNSYTFYLPRIKYSGGSIDVSGESPVSISLPFTALKDAGVGNTLKITR